MLPKVGRQISKAGKSISKAVRQSMTKIFQQVGTNERRLSLMVGAQPGTGEFNVPD
jgi:hypothetical protein